MPETATSRPPLALIANDEEWWTRSLESFLAPKGYAIIRAYTGQQALERAHEATLDLIILDAEFPDLSGLEVCRRLRSDPRITTSTPILMTTAGRYTREQRLEALGAGAWDFLGLPLDAEELLLRLGSYLRAKFDADRIREEGMVDPLTGLYNLRGLMRRARELGSDAYRHGRGLACVAFAPQVQAAEGSGDAGQVLWSAVERVAGVFRAQGRVSDAIGRIREGEFVVIAPDTDEEGAYRLARRLVDAVQTRALEEGKAPLILLAGYDAVPDLRAAGIQPAALLAAATTALRRTESEPGGETIRRASGQ